MSPRRTSFRWLVLFAWLFTLPLLVFADDTPINADFISQYGLRNLENAIAVHADPPNPEAGGTVTFTAESPVFDLVHDLITWRIDGAVTASGVGLTTANGKVDSRGDSLDVSVTAVDPVWGTATYSFTLTPLQVDILYDAPTYVPPFYRGRALPSAGGQMRLQALARLVKNGALLKDDSINYTWSRNGTVLGKSSGTGRSSVTIDAPSLFSSDTISVKASSIDGSLSANASISIPNQDVVIGLYENHPLFGIMFHKMLPKENTGLADEINVAAFPYFATSPGLYDPDLRLAWTLNNAPLAASSTKRNEVTVVSGDGVANLRLSVTHLSNFFLEAVRTWKFGVNGDGAQQPANNSDQPDAFHSSTQP